MIRPGMVWGLARAESRLCRRLVRYWVFQSLAAVVGMFFYLYYFFIHYKFSSFSGTAAMLNPRYLISVVGIYYTIAFLLGLVFLGYDVRARDGRERMSEVLDTLPCTNLELLLGKYLGILIPCWIPVCLIITFLGILSAALGQPIEPRSMIAFVLLLIIPAYLFVLGLTFLLTLLLRHRLLAAVAVIGILVGIIVINFGFTPVYLLPAVDLTGGFSLPWPSAMIPLIADLPGLLQRIATALAGLAMLWLAAAMHPRKDDSSRAMTAGLGVAMLVVAAALVSYVVWDVKSVLRQKTDWKMAHEARGQEPVPDLLVLSGDVRLHPGDDLAMDLALRFRAPSESTLQTALFSLNPDLVVAAVREAGGGELVYEHEDGLLDIQLARSLAPGEETTIEMTIEGTPHLWYGYLDAAFDPLSINIRDGNIFMLGFFNYINDSRFVALLPGSRWLPATGPDVGRGDPKVHPTDFFEVDLEVELPHGWLAAGPGRRREVEEPAADGRVRYRFVSSAPVPDVALVAGRYESRTTEIDGVTLEILVHPAHAETVDFFVDAGGEIESWMGERLGEAAEIGLRYPYDGLTLVEVPGSLRGYAGGWRMDSTMIQPAMVLMRESGFPTANFESRFKNPRPYEDQEGGLPRAKMRAAASFFENDFIGGNPFVAAARSFFGHLTSGEGAEGLPLDYVCESLATELVTERTGYFSVHIMGEDMNQAIQRSIGVIFRSGGGDDMAKAVIHALASRNAVWDEVLEVSLADMDPWEDPQKTVDVLTIKGGAMARSMLDDLGRTQTGNLLASLRERKAGETFSGEDVVLAGEEIGEDLAPWMDVWIHQTDLPGFIMGDAELYRIEDSEDGSPSYQVLVTVRNEEATPGLVRLEYRSGGGRAGGRGGGERGESEPYRIGANRAVDIGLVTSTPPRVVRIVPYLALNREGFTVPLPGLDEEKIIDAEPFTGVRDSDWVPDFAGVIIIDDLDDGFSIEDSGERSWWRFGGRGGDEELDQGLPVAQYGPRRAAKWSRWTFGNAYGKYRHTTAVIKKGSGARSAVFSAEIPSAGQWELEYYLPRRPGRGSARRGRSGTWDLTVTDNSESREIKFDADGGEPGWNSLGTFEIAEGEVRVAVSDKTDGDFVLADAIRWVADN